MRPRASALLVLAFGCAGGAPPPLLPRASPPPAPTPTPAVTAEAAPLRVPASLSPAHPFHALQAVHRTHVWAKPHEELSDGAMSFGERLIFRDTATQAELWRLTYNPVQNAVPYANAFPWNADGSLLLLSSRERPGGGWLMLLSADGTRVQPPAGVGSMVNPTWASDDPDVVLCSHGRALLRINVRTGRKTLVATIPPTVEGRISFNPRGRYAVACREGPGAQGKVTLIDLRNGKVRPIRIESASADPSGDWLHGAGVDDVGDAPRVVYSLNHLPQMSAEHPYQQWAVDLRTGQAHPVSYLSHGGVSPRRDRKVGYQAGAIFSTDYFGRDKKFVVEAPQPGHIAWMSSPEWFLSGHIGAPGTSEFAGLLAQVFLSTGNVCRIAYGNTANATYESMLFVNTSPDGTKAEYTSTMLGPKDLYWAVMNRPEPPSKVDAVRRARGVELRFQPPARSRELRGYHVFRAPTSGGPYRVVSGPEPVKSPWLDVGAPSGAALYYVVTSVEHSTLESRRFSSEAAVGPSGTTGWPGAVRAYFEAETGRASPPLAEDFHGSASCDRFVAHRSGRGEGQLALPVRVPSRGAYELWCRVRGEGRFQVELRGSAAGVVEVESPAWVWVRMTTPLRLVAGASELTFVSASAGSAVDKVLLTDDRLFTPSGMGDTDGPAPAVPAGLRVAAVGSFDVALRWTAASGPEVHHYQVYRGSKADFTPSQQALVGSPGDGRFLDWGLEAGTTYHYAVTAVDAFGHASEPARAFAATPSLPRRVLVEREAEGGIAHNGLFEVVQAAAASGGSYLVTPEEERAVQPFRLEIPFEVGADGRYMVWVSAAPVVDEHVYLGFDIDGRRHGMFYMQSAHPSLSSRPRASAARFLWHALGGVGQGVPAMWDLAAGKHVLSLSLVGQAGFEGRRTAIDRVIVTNDLAFEPEGRKWSWQIDR